MSLWDTFAPKETTYYPTTDHRFFWIIRAPTFANEHEIAKWFNESSRSQPEIVSHELAMTFGGTSFPAADCNVAPGDDGYRPGLRDNATTAEIITFLGSLPALMVNEMWAKLKEVAPQWGPTFPRKLERPKQSTPEAPDGDGVEGTDTGGEE